MFHIKTSLHCGCKVQATLLSNESLLFLFYLESLGFFHPYVVSHDNFALQPTSLMPGK